MGCCAENTAYRSAKYKNNKGGKSKAHSSKNTFEDNFYKD
jgi:hypothetical protein